MPGVSPLAGCCSKLRHVKQPCWATPNQKGERSPAVRTDLPCAHWVAALLHMVAMVRLCKISLSNSSEFMIVVWDEECDHIASLFLPQHVDTFVEIAASKLSDNRDPNDDGHRFWCNTVIIILLTITSALVTWARPVNTTTITLFLLPSCWLSCGTRVTCAVAERHRNHW